MSKVNRIIFNGTELDLQDDEAIRHTEESYTEDQKAQARENIDAAPAESIGDIESALDTIIAIQEELINNGGGDEGVYCPNCGEPMNDPTYCENCGFRQLLCGNCGSYYEDTGGPCPDCGL